MKESKKRRFNMRSKSRAAGLPHYRRERTCTALQRGDRISAYGFPGTLIPHDKATKFAQNNALTHSLTHSLTIQLDWHNVIIWRHYGVTLMHLLVELILRYPGCQRLFMRGFRFRRSCFRPRPTKLLVAREKKPLVPWVILRYSFS